jgi:hypothetical protein
MELFVRLAGRAVAQLIFLDMWITKFSSNGGESFGPSRKTGCVSSPASRKTMSG